MNRKRIETAARGASSRPPGRPRSKAAHVAILAAAIDLTREVGYDALAMDAIAARAGVGKATVYRRWPSKEAIMAEAVEWIVRLVPTPDTGHVEGDLLVLMLATMRMYQDPATGPLLSGLIAAMVRSPLIAEKIRRGFIGVRLEAMREALRRGVSRGELRADLDLELTLDLLSGPMLFRSLVTGGRVDEEMTRGILRVVLRGLTP
jgi:AcrR family transcriptional regulator